MSLPPSSRYPICLSCVQWSRRAKKRRSAVERKCHTPLDSIILHALAPGRFSEPDLRCFLRLAATASDPDNGFSSVIPDRIREILAKAEDDKGASTLGVLRAWWRANENTACFRHAETARAVRHTFVHPDAAQQGVRRRWRR